MKEWEDNLFNPWGLLWAPNPSKPYTLPVPAAQLPSAATSSPVSHAGLMPQQVYYHSGNCTRIPAFERVLMPSLGPYM
jgi:hypothetical protein